MAFDPEDFSREESFISRSSLSFRSFSFSQRPAMTLAVKILPCCINSRSWSEIRYPACSKEAKSSSVSASQGFVQTSSENIRLHPRCAISSLIFFSVSCMVSSEKSWVLLMIIFPEERSWENIRYLLVGETIVETGVHDGENITDFTAAFHRFCEHYVKELVHIIYPRRFHQNPVVSSGGSVSSIF